MTERNRENAGKNWLLPELKELQRRFGERMPIEQMANEHGRSAGALVGKLLQLQLLMQDRNGFYYRVEADPWISYHDVRHVDKGADA
jgi:hypothetical protein